MRIEKSFKDGDEWKNTTTFSVEDLPKGAMVANEAYKDIRLRTNKSGDES